MGSTVISVGMYLSEIVCTKYNSSQCMYILNNPQCSTLAKLHQLNFVLQCNSTCRTCWKIHSTLAENVLNVVCMQSFFLILAALKYAVIIHEFVNVIGLGGETLSTRRDYGLAITWKVSLGNTLGEKVLDNQYFSFMLSGNGMRCCLNSYRKKSKIVTPWRIYFSKISINLVI